MSIDLTHEDVHKILNIIDDAKHLEELDLTYGDFRLHIRRHGVGNRPDPSCSSGPSPEAASAPAPAVAPSLQDSSPVERRPEPAAQPVPEGMIAIRAPMLGTFYRSPSPGEKPFVEVGQSVTAEDTVCLIEIMKLFNSIKAGVDGKVAAIRAENAALVDYDEVLLLIEPSKK